ncbi:MAG: hypothetical protein RIR86_2152 [Acidobacteriota bacterium]
MKNSQWTTSEASRALRDYLQSDEAKRYRAIFGDQRLTAEDRLVFLADLQRRTNCLDESAGKWWNLIEAMLGQDQEKRLVLAELLAQHGLDVEDLYGCLPDNETASPFTEAARLASSILVASIGRIPNDDTALGKLRIDEADAEAQRWWAELTAQAVNSNELMLRLASDIVARGGTLATFRRVLRECGTDNLQAGLCYLEYLDRRQNEDPFWWTRPGKGMTRTRGWSDDQIRARLVSIREVHQVDQSGETHRHWESLEERYHDQPGLLLRLAEELHQRRMPVSSYLALQNRLGNVGVPAVLAFLDYEKELERDQDRINFQVVTLDDHGVVQSTAQGNCVHYLERLGPGLHLEMVLIPAGSFVMGSPEDESRRTEDEGPQHEVILHSFYMGRYPVTQEQWRIVAGWPRCQIDLNPDPSNFKGDLKPVETVSWYEAVEFCERLRVQTGRHYRLPSESEWEYACRAGTTTPFAFGQSINPDIVNYNGNYPYAKANIGIYRKQTTEVGSLPYANNFGLADMHGNVWEWVEDVWHKNYEDAPDNGSAWVSGGDSSLRVLRGGSWLNYGDSCRSALRYDLTPGTRVNYLGFRVVVGERAP